MVYKIIELNNHIESSLEAMGSKEKFWLTDKDGGKRLFKFSKAATGEHWSEKCASELCKLLHIPHAQYDIARHKNKFGVITPNFIPDNSRMIMGNELLHLATNDYPVPNDQYLRIKEHTVNRVLQCLDQNILPPISNYTDIGHLRAPDMFCGYLMLDTLISNQDRHHENWAIMLNNQTREQFLCPTYDHAASLGRELTDENCYKRLTTKDKNQQVSAFVSRAKSKFYDENQGCPLSTIDAFRIALDSPLVNEGKKFWLQKLRNLSDMSIERIFYDIPEECISLNVRKFALEIVLENKKRLLDL